MALRRGIFALCSSITSKMLTQPIGTESVQKNLCLFELSVQGFSKLMKQGTGEPKNVEGTQRGALDCDLEALAFCKDDATT
jgi:hypothetical protein